MVTIDKRAGDIYSADMLGKGVLHILGGKEQKVMSFHHTNQKSTQPKTYELRSGNVAQVVRMSALQL
jgi:hypothetical protein